MYSEGMCLADDDEHVSASPFGIDPAFLPTSHVYNGKLHPEQYYHDHEFSPGGLPYGFFPTWNDITSDLDLFKNVSASGVNGTHPGEPKFRVYLDTRFSAAEALAAVSYLHDGYFLDNLTQALEVDMLMFNPSLGMISSFQSEFHFLDGGQIETTITVTSRALKDFEMSAENIVGLAILVACSLGILRTEVKEILVAIKTRKVWGYVTELWNILDWLSFVSIPVSIITYNLFGQIVLNNVSFVTHSGNVSIVCSIPSLHTIHAPNCMHDLCIGVCMRACKICWLTSFCYTFRECMHRLSVPAHPRTNCVYACIYACIPARRKFVLVKHPMSHIPDHVHIYIYIYIYI
jgi:hypothetical protein